MKKLFAAVVLCCLASGLYGQGSGLPPQARVRLKKDRPGVYLTFERIGEIKSPTGDKGERRIWLRFHNNTRWSIMLDMRDVPSKEYGDVGLFYDVVLGKEVIIQRQCHVCTHNALGSGRSLVFSIPVDDFTEESLIRVRFSYGWEDWDDAATGREAQHYVYFYASRLPKSTQPSKK